MVLKSASDFGLVRCLRRFPANARDANHIF